MSTSDGTPQGSHDGTPGTGTGDHDQEFVQFQPYHFTVRQMARLVALRSRLGDTAAERMQEAA